MAEKTTWIKLDRNILEWRWYQDANTFRVFLHLLLTANIKDREVGKRVVSRGVALTNYNEIAAHLGMTYAQVRRAVDNLKETGECTTVQHGRFVEISIPCYDEYQASNTTETQPKHNRNTTDHYKKDKNVKKTPSLTLPHKPYLIPSPDEVSEYERESGTGKDPELFYRHYSALDWKANGKPIYDWKALYRVWEAPPQTKRAKEKRASTFTDEDGFVYEWVNGTYEVRKGKR